MILTLQHIQQFVDNMCEEHTDNNGNVNLDHLPLWPKMRLHKAGCISYDECWRLHCKQLPAFVGFPWNICKDCKGQEAFGYLWSWAFYGHEHTWQRQMCYMSDRMGYGYCVTTRQRKYSLVNWLWWPHVKVSYHSEVGFSPEQYDTPENSCSDVHHITTGQ